MFAIIKGMKSFIKIQLKQFSEEYSFEEGPWFWQMCNSTIKMQIYDQPRCFIRSVYSVSMEKVGLVLLFFFCFFFVL